MEDKITLNESVTMTVHSNHLFYSNKKKVEDLLSEKDLDNNNLIDIFFSLHLVLELGINNIFRHIVSTDFKKQIDRHKLEKNIDNISFIEKTILFIYLSKFNFSDVDKATNYHKIIEKMRSFSGIRNKLFHGHSISEISKDGITSKSELKKKLNTDNLQKQIDDFNFITEGLSFYLRNLETTFTEAGIEQLINTYLTFDFIINK